MISALYGTNKKYGICQKIEQKFVSLITLISWQLSNLYC